MPDFKDFSQDPSRIAHEASKGTEHFKKALREHDEEIIRRREMMTGSIKEICNDKSLDPSKLTIKLLQQFIIEYPERFLNLRSAKSILAKYFLGSMETVKELLLEK